jgi:hypothetical protein
METLGEIYNIGNKISLYGEMTDQISPYVTDQISPYVEMTDQISPYVEMTDQISPYVEMTDQILAGAGLQPAP